MPELIPYDLPGGGLFARVLGIALLVAGRRILWLAVAVIGCLVAAGLAGRYLDLGSEAAELLVGVLAGVLGVFLAIFLQKVAVGLVGFLVGGYAAVDLLGGDPGVLTAAEAMIFLVAGVVCAVLALMLFEWALVVLSSLAGAAMILDGVGRDPAEQLLIYLLLVVLGIAVQMGIGPRKRRRRYRRDEE